MTSFNLFPLLPVELQLQIWTAAVHGIGSRIVYISETLRDPSLDKTDPESYLVDGEDIRTQEIDTADPPHQYRSKSTVTYLYVCRQSRAVTSEIYTRAFATHATSSYIWFDFSRDVLYVNLESESFLGEVHLLFLKTTHIVLGDISGDCDRVKNFALAFKAHKAWPGRPYPRYALQLGVTHFAKCQNVERILLVDGQHEWEDTADLVDVKWAEMVESLPLLRSDDSLEAKLSRLSYLQTGLGRSYRVNLTNGDFYTEGGESRLHWLPKGAKGLTAKIEKRTVTTRSMSQEFETLMEDLRKASPDDLFWTEYRAMRN